MRLHLAKLAVLGMMAGFPLATLAQDSNGMSTPGMTDGTEPSLLRHDVVKSIAPDERLMLVLERFTYGPKPGDLGRLRTMGLNAWFKEQLNPSRIDDSALESRLANYPAMQLPLDRLMETYPTNQMIREAMNGRIGTPMTGATRAIYNDQEARYKARLAKKDGKGSDSGKGDDVSLPQSPGEFLAMTPDKRFKAICKLTLPQLRMLRQGLSAEQRPLLTAGMTPAQVEAIAAFNGPTGVVQAEDVQVKLLRDVYSERQLQEVMVDFWLNHFNVYMKKSQEAPYYIAAYERRAIRPFALGRFGDLLLATATSPAMLNYLDNSSSVGPDSEFATGLYGPNRTIRLGLRQNRAGLNENYAREVMELHTVGANGGYTQKDVTELAKVFTGWTVGRGYQGDALAVAEFDPTKHEPGDKMVMGHKIKMDGQREGINALRMLASSPECAKFISTKLAVRFVNDTPPPSMVDRMAKTFLETDGDIRQVLLVMVNSPEFFTAATYQTKLKTPQDFVVSAVRATNATVTSTAGMQAAVEELGMPLYGMQTPNGYSMKAEAWNSTSQLVSRMNFAMALASDRVAGVHADPAGLLGDEGALMTPEQKTKRLEAVLLHAMVSEKTQRLILAQVTTDEQEQKAQLQQLATIRGQRDPLQMDAPLKRPGDMTGGDTQAAMATGLILGSPEFQRR